MDVERLIGTMIQGALAGRRKRSHGARRFLRGGGSPFLTASTLLTVGGLVWGAIETMQQQGRTTGEPPPSPGSAPPAMPLQGQGPAAVPPVPVPGGPGLPIPSPESSKAREGAIPEGAARLVRLMISAARADGMLSETERATILEHAAAAGAESLVADEIDHPTPLASILEGIADGQQRADLYVLAYAIVRADEAVSGSERIYLARVGALLQLDDATVERLERDADTGINTAAAER